MRITWLTLAALGIIIGSAGALPGLHTGIAHATVEPSRVPISWELGFKYGPMERITVDVAGTPTPFWFMRYTVANNSGKDVLFTPNFEIVGESGVAMPAFKNVPSTVFEKIKTLYKNNLMLSPTDVYGKLLQGDDNAKDGVIIFPALDPDSRNFQLFIMGLSGETAEVKNPITNKPVILQKTLELDLNIPGQAIGIDPQSKVTTAKWVMK